MRECKMTDTCRAIYRATLELVAEQGFHGTPMSQIAKHADVAVGSIYRYVEDKDDLIHHVHSDVDNRMMDALRSGYKERASEKELFFIMITTLTTHFIENPLEFKFMEQYYNSPYGIQKKREQCFEQVSDDKSDRPFMTLLKGESFKKLPMPTLHALAFGPMIFAVRDHHCGLQNIDDALLASLVESCWDAVRVR